MKITLRLSILLSTFLVADAFLVLRTAPVRAEPTLDGQMTILLQDLHRSDWQTRSDAFFKIVGPMEDEPPLTYELNNGKPIPQTIRHALIDLLWRESKRVAAMEADAGRGSFGQAMDEDQSEYWAALTLAVGALHDPDALDTLLSPTVLKDGGNNTAAIAELGEPIVSRLLDKFGGSNDPIYRSRLVAIFCYMLDHRLLLSPQNKEKLRAAFLTESYSSNEVARISSIKGLLLSGDDLSVHRVRELADADPFILVNKKDGSPTYPVRAEANRALQSWQHLR